MKYDKELLQEQSFEISTLSDLDLSTGDDADFEAFLHQLDKQLDTSEITTEFAPPPSGSLGGLVPRTKLIIRIPKFSFGIFQTILASLWMSYQRNDPLNMTVGGGFALLDGINRIRDSFYTLKEYEGEYCTYLSIMRAVDYDFLYHLQTIKQKLIWEQHQTIRENCKEFACQYHNDHCSLKEQEFDKILESLIAREVIFSKDKKIGIKL